MKVKWPIETHEPNTNWARLVQLTKWAWLSPSSEGIGLYILRTDHGTISCACKGFQYRNKCRHAEALRDRIGLELTPIPSAWLEPEPEPKTEPSVEELVAELY